MIRNISKNKGFTLLEMIVALGVFIISMLIAVGSMLSVVDANRKANSQQILMDNLQFALDGMVRNIRVGTTYHCDVDVGVITDTRDCSDGEPSIAFEDAEGDSADSSDQFVYRYDAADQEIEMSRDSGANWSVLTAPDVVVENLTFYVVGSGDSDMLQPRTLIVLDGYVEVNEKIRSDFNIQTLVTQRITDG